MSQAMIITSLQNPMVKRIALLQQKASERQRAGLFAVEGLREVGQCLAAGYEIETLYFCRDYVDEHTAEKWQSQPYATEVSAPVYQKMAYRGGTEGLLAIVKDKKLRLTDLKTETKPLYVVLESVEKPGNLGAILRSADAAQASAVIVCDPRCDLGNPNLIRNSLGARFTVPLVACSSGECIQFLKERHVQILTAQLQDSHLYYDTDMTGATALVMGTESQGLTDQWRQAADRHIRIPMQGRIDSLNVSVSTAILLFEAVRQRLATHSL